MKRNADFSHFNKAMDMILRADPKAVKLAIDQEQREHAEERAARGEHKRGRKRAAKKRPLPSPRASGDRG